MSRRLVACFLDVAKAYDSVPQNLLLQRIADLGMPQVWTDLLRRLYKDNKVVTKFSGITTEPVAVKRGLMQGCPLPPLLYMLYASGLEQCILECGKGFTQPSAGRIADHMDTNRACVCG